MVWHSGLLHKLNFWLSKFIILPFFNYNGFELFLRGSLCKNTQLMQEFLKVPFLILHFPSNIVMTFLVILSVILLSTLMILESTLSVIRHLICGNNQTWILNLYLICMTLKTGAGSIVDFNHGKKELPSFDWFSNSGVFDAKMEGSVLEGK